MTRNVFEKVNQFFNVDSDKPQKGQERFGKRGVRNAKTKKVIRSDHPTMGDVVKDTLHRITRGGLKTDERTRKHTKKAR